jgi:hypothetical protein
MRAKPPSSRAQAGKRAPLSLFTRCLAAPRLPLPPASLAPPQGDLERSLGLPVSPCMDRSQPGISASQAGFSTLVVLPMLHQWAALLPAAGPLLYAAVSTRAQWEGEAIAARGRAAAEAAEAAAAASAAGATGGTTGGTSLPTPPAQMVAARPPPLTASPALLGGARCQLPAALAAGSGRSGKGFKGAC